MAIVNHSQLLPWNEHNIQQAPDATGVYELGDSTGHLLYVGRTIEPRRLRRRLLEHWRLKDIPGVANFAWYQTDSEESAAAIEADWIKKHQPPYNIQGR